VSAPAEPSGENTVKAENVPNPAAAEGEPAEPPSSGENDPAA